MGKRIKLDPKSFEILRLISEGVPEQDMLDGQHGISPEDIANAARRALDLLGPAYSMEAIRQQHARAYAKWTTGEERRLIQLYHDGNSIRTIAAELKRQPGAIRSRLDRLLGGAPDPGDQRPAPAESPVERAESSDAPSPSRERPANTPEGQPVDRCRRCGTRIPQDRLDAVLEVTLCVRCQERTEHGEPDEDDDLECPRCRRKLIWKQPRDPEDTVYFLACSGFPDCTYIDPTTGRGFRRRR